jgi:hypothetical protein
MAAIKFPKLASDFNIDVPREQMLAESARALKQIERTLIAHLMIGRTLAAARQELREHGVNQNDGVYSAELNRWIAEHQPKLQPAQEPACRLDLVHRELAQRSALSQALQDQLRGLAGVPKAARGGERRV